MQLNVRLAILLMVSAVPAVAQTNLSTQLKRGKTLATQNCAQCHAVGRKGRSPHKKAPPLRTLAMRYPVEHLAEALAEGIRTGHPDMPEFKFAPKDVGALIAYLKHVNAKKK